MTPDNRKAALLLHALSEQDRQWALSRLTTESRMTADGLLVELRTLGIPADESLIRDALLAVPASPVKGTEELLFSACAADVARLLQHESVRTVALVLALEKWPWEEIFLASLEPEFRANVLRVRAELLAATVPPVLAGTLRTVLRERLAALTSSLPASVSSGRWRWLRKRGRS